MPEHRIEARFDMPMSAVFAALVQELGRERWSDVAGLGHPVNLPAAGLRFGYRQSRRLYCGEVIECLRPVSITIVESYRGPAGSIASRQRWRVDSVASLTRLAGELRFELNRFARLQTRFWKAHFAGSARRTCARVRTHLLEEGAFKDASSCVVVANARGTEGVKAE